jgi:hypothetical protein
MATKDNDPKLLSAAEVVRIEIAVAEEAAAREAWHGRATHERLVEALVAAVLRDKPQDTIAYAKAFFAAGGGADAVPREKY